MRTILTCFVFLLCFNAVSAQTKKAVAKSEDEPAVNKPDTTAKKADPRFVGAWKGFDKGSQIEGVTIYWVQHRTADGAFISLFTNIHEDGEVESTAEKGKWWVENGIFYELHFNSGNTDTYTFEILAEDEIKFKLKSTEIELAKKEYEFVDTKIEMLEE